MDFEKIIYQINDIYKPVAIYRCGSSILVDNPRDIDIVLIYSNKQEMIEKQNIHNESLKLILDKNKINILSSNLDMFFDIMAKFPYESGKYWQFLYGNKLDDEKYNVNILTNKAHRERSIRLALRQAINYIYEDTCRDMLVIKPYRLLFFCYILDNNSHDLTDDQLKKINAAHDENKISLEQAKYCLNVLERILINEFGG